jgi:phage terminase large subunit-like protein
VGIEADQWQKNVLLSVADRILMCCSRQSGKSQTAAALALKTALLSAPSEVLIVSRTQRQADELILKVKEMRRWLRTVLAGGAAKRRRRRSQPTRTLEMQAREEALQGSTIDASVTGDSVRTEYFANGSRVISLPGKADTFVGFSPDLLIIDEASRVPDDTYRACRPMLAVSGGRLVCLSTPFGKRGFFYEEWVRYDSAKTFGKRLPWEAYRIPVTQCPRISPDFLEEERQALGERWYRQEYECSFEDPVGAVFTSEQVKGLMSGTGGALW